LYQFYIFSQVQTFDNLELHRIGATECKLAGRVSFNSYFREFFILRNFRYFKELRRQTENILE